MENQVTPEQYARQVDARDNWPKELSAGSSYSQGNGCILIYLAQNAGIAISDNFAGALSEGREKISQCYGIPTQTLDDWRGINDLIPASRPIRAKAMLCKFQRYLDEAEVVEPLQTGEPEVPETRSDARELELALR